MYHDCGKPYCRSVDTEGKTHFVNHAAVSRETYLTKVSDNVVIANLIGWDMVLHTCTGEELHKYMTEVWTPKDAFTLLITAFAEIHANASMFGGIESLSFKIKYKHLCKQGKRMVGFYEVECPKN